MRELAGAVQANLRVTQAIEQLFADAEAAGRGELDYSAILAQLDEPSISRHCMTSTPGAK